MVKQTQTIRRQKSTNCLSVFDHFVELALKGLRRKLTSSKTKRVDENCCVLMGDVENGWESFEKEG